MSKQSPESARIHFEFPSKKAYEQEKNILKSNDLRLKGSQLERLRIERLRLKDSQLEKLRIERLRLKAFVQDEF